MISKASRGALEFPELLRVIASQAATDLGRERLLALRPFDSEDDLRGHRARYEEARRLIVGRALLPYCERPFAPLLIALEGGAQGLTGKELVEVGSLLGMGAEAVERILKADPVCPELAAMAEAVPSSAELRRKLKKTFDSRGEIREDATPHLAAIKGKLRQTRQRVYKLLKSTYDAHQDDLEENIPLRGGRLVLMMASGSKGRIPGLVHGRSATGRSFYFEPLEAVEENNELQQTSEEEDAEKRRIMADIVQSLRQAWPCLEAHVHLIADLDHLQTSVRFAEVSEGQLAELGPRHSLKLVAARHPLIDPRLAARRREALGTEGHLDPIIPLDVELSPECRVLVVTGPNAGGKTVALKTLGLLALAHQCGLPIPVAAGTCLPFFNSLVATVGDDQDLLADRSTFSGRLLRLKEVWDVADEDTLVLLDELGSGTDPDEGAALSTAILESLIERRSLVFVTTHLSQVAAAALEAEEADCAAMLFDSATGHPTYRLLPGPPGGSEAIALAKRLGLPEQWLRRADELLGTEHRELRRLLSEVESSRRQLAEAQARVDQELEDAEKLRQRQSELESELRQERKTLSRRLTRQLEEFRDTTRRSLAAEVEALRQEVKQTGRKKGVAAKATEKLFAEAPVFETADEADEETEIVVGGVVRHRRLGWEGVLEKSERGKAHVRVQGKLFTCRETDLSGLVKSPEQLKSASGGSSTRRNLTNIRQEAKQRSERPESQASQQIDLIGQRVVLSLELLDRFLDQALLASHPTVRVVHGHGSGQLRRAVREFLSGHQAVANWRPGKADEGGDGATLVELVG